jgi:hypothetical protein
MHPVVRILMQSVSSFVRYGRAYFDGSGSYLSTPNSSGFYFNNSPYTVELIINFPTITGVQVIVEQFTAPSGPGWTIYRTGNQVAIYNTSELKNTTALVDGSDYHIAFVGDGSGATKIFIDGVQDGSATGMNAANSTTSPLYIGSRSGSGNFLNAYVKGVRITKRERYTSNFSKPSYFDVDGSDVTLCMNFAEQIGATTFIDDCAKTITTYGNTVIVE